MAGASGRNVASPTAAENRSLMAATTDSIETTPLDRRTHPAAPHSEPAFSSARSNTLTAVLSQYIGFRFETASTTANEGGGI